MCGRCRWHGFWATSSRRDFLDGVALGQTTPGPLAAQVVMWLGFLRAGTLGALAAAAAFIAPSFLLVLAVAVVYVHYQGLPVVQALFHGIAPAAMAIIAVAAYKLARITNHRDLRLWAISVVLAVVTTAWRAEGRGPQRGSRLDRCGRRADRVDRRRG
jgi:chromate transporter